MRGRASHVNDLVEQAVAYRPTHRDRLLCSSMDAMERARASRQGMLGLFDRPGRQARFRAQPDICTDRGRSLDEHVVFSHTLCDVD